jgi:uncharacterized protein YuzE
MKVTYDPKTDTLTIILQAEFRSPRATRTNRVSSSIMIRKETLFHSRFSMRPNA